MKRALAIATVLTAASLAGCSSYREERVVTGAAVGGASGAITGGVASGTPGGAIAGGAIGAVAGAVVADATRPRYYGPRYVGRRCYWNPEIGRRVCRW
ncbi:MAG TPA: hypothetical protein PKA55_14480 [Rhodoblastus sp.]|nr:hypothetical protein [Rhodoblastus sp.]